MPTTLPPSEQPTADTNPQVSSVDVVPQRSRLIPTLFASLLLAGLVLAGYNYYLNTTSVSTALPLQTEFEEEAPVTVPEYPKEWKLFQSDLGFRFLYPANWGTAAATLLDAKENSRGTSGKIYEVEFSNAPEGVWGSGRSNDFAAARTPTRADYRGENTTEPQVTSYIDVVDPGCYYLPPRNTFMGAIDITLPNEEITGVRIFLPTLSDSDIEKMYKKFDILPGDGDDCINNQELAEKNSKIGAEIQDYIKNEKNLDATSKVYRAIFDEMAASVSFGTLQLFTPEPDFESLPKQTSENIETVPKQEAGESLPQE